MTFNNSEIGFHYINDLLLVFYCSNYSGMCLCVQGQYIFTRLWKRNVQHLGN